jgi:purine catabolism regulator
MVDGGRRMSAQPIGVGGRVEAVLVLGTRDALGQLEGIVASHAVSLLAIEFDKTASVATAERTAKGDFLEALFGGEMEDQEAAEGLGRFGFGPGEPVQVVALDGPTPVGDLAWAVEDVLSRRSQAFLTSPRGETLIALLPLSVDVGEVRSEVAAKLSAPLLAGIGSAVPAAEAARGMREAMHALRVCTLEGTSIADFASLGTYRLLLSLQDPDALRAFVEAVLNPLDEYDTRHGGELVSSLQAFLDHNARWESAADELMVHRHTLRYRMRKVEELTGRDLDSARDRMEFWLALRARELQAGS